MKAIVMETRGREAAILLKDGTFRTVKGRYSVGETIDYQETVRPAFRKWMAAAAAAVIMIGAGGGFWYDANYVAYAEISLDVNPSIVYTVNKRNRVLEVRAVNDEAAEAVSALNEEGVRFMPVADAIDRAMMLFENEGYLDAENEDYVLMNVSADNAGIHERVTSEIETGMGRAMERDPSMEYRVDHSDRATARRAEDSDMSTGRYAVWEQEGAGREQEEYAQMPVRELMGKPEESTPAAPNEGGAPQTERSTPTTSMGGIQGEGAVREQEQNLAVPRDKPDESSKTGSQPSAETQMETGTEPSQGEFSPSVQQDGGDWEQSSLPNRDAQRNGMSQGSPINAPGGQGNQTPR